MKVWDGKQLFKYAHIKRDGFQISVRKRDNCLIYLTKNFNVKDLSFLPGHSTWLKRMDESQVLLCELWRPGKHASYVSSGISQRDTQMKLHCFAVMQGLDAAAPLHEAAALAHSIGMEFIDYYSIGQHMPLCRGVINNLSDIKLDFDIEGFVLKNHQFTDCVKWKPFKDATLRIVGTEAGLGKFHGLIGSIICADEQGVIRCNAGGMTDIERLEMTRLNAEGLLCGRLVDIKYQRLDSNGRLRHPSFVRFRFDKDTADESICGGTVL